MKTFITVNGMSCPKCVAHVKEALEELDGVQNVTVDLASKTAVVVSDNKLDSKDIISALEDFGYHADDVSHE